MVRSALFALALLAALLPSTVRADPFTIDLVARTAKTPKGVAAGTSPRAILNADRAAPITVQWTVRNPDPAVTAKDVLVHVFVVRQARPDQPGVPKLTGDVAVESALTMDFRPRDQAEGTFTCTIPQAGCYLVRVELKGAAAQGEREPFAALDLLVR